ncbi:DivIVA domain-containing protein [Candidatus Soleaferrea massiliensis]|uniref:DivIVA domain-containing protein n=1 Tax=Candidatus Soleaferrea massiliensis TaxID=1470354 RepID=UPI0005900F36|nr:DivIVA domain-containing protein [Candidatus Soleaferrea massiliensis]
MTPNNIKEVRFRKSFRGYDVRSVEAYKEEVAKAYANLLEEKEDLEEKLRVVAGRLQEYIKEEDSLSKAILCAQKTGDQLVAEAEEKAARIVEHANQQTEQMMENTRRQIEREQLSLNRLQHEVSNFKSKLISIYKTHIELITALPDEEVDESARSVKVEEKADAPAKSRASEEKAEEEENLAYN